MRLEVQRQGPLELTSSKQILLAATMCVCVYYCSTYKVVLVGEGG
jgi:hypothetical protein